MVEQIRAIGRDPELIAETLQETRAQVEGKIGELVAESGRLARQLKRDQAELHTAATGAETSRLADVQDRIRVAEQRETEIQNELAALARQRIDESEVAAALGSFDPVWESLSPREQVRILRMLLERVEFDGGTDELAITFQPHGIKTLAAEAMACV